LLLGELANGLLTTDHCGKHPCPKYKVIGKTEEFECRYYPKSNYAFVNEYGVSYLEATKRNLKKLLAYMNGNNEEGKKIPITVPAITILLSDGKGHYFPNFAMLMWLPEEFQADPPRPKKAKTRKEQVMISNKDSEIICFTRGYGFWPTEAQIKYNDDRLQASLTAAGIVAGKDYHRYFVYSLVYNYNGDETQYNEVGRIQRLGLKVSGNERSTFGL